MKTGRTMRDFAIEIDRQNAAKRDFICNTLGLEAAVQTDGNIALNMDMAAGSEQFPIQDMMHRQIATNLDIPMKYYNRMQALEPQLLTANINAWFRQKPVNRMIRTLDLNGRAYLSNSYRRIDNFEIAQSVLPIIGEMNGARIESCELTESRMYIKVVNEKLEAEVLPGDAVQAGIVISNSEVGAGAVSVTPLIYRLVCSNGMIVKSAGTKRNHIGRNIGGDENRELYSDEALIADDKALMLKLRDTVRAATDEAKFATVVNRMREAHGMKMETPNIKGAVELAAKDYGLTQEDGAGMLQHLMAGGDLSLYGLANSATRYSQDVECYDKATELETVGYEILAMHHKTWADLLERSSLM